MFLSGCGGTSGGSCGNCTGKPALNSVYTSDGGVTDSCAWSCEPRYYLIGSSCSACATCDMGEFRSGCSGASAGSCATCAACSNSGDFRFGCSGFDAGTCRPAFVMSSYMTIASLANVAHFHRVSEPLRRGVAAGLSLDVASVTLRNPTAVTRRLLAGVSFRTDAAVLSSEPVTAQRAAQAMSEISNSTDAQQAFAGHLANATGLAINSLAVTAFSVTTPDGSVHSDIENVVFVPLSTQALSVETPAPVTTDSALNIPVVGGAAGGGVLLISGAVFLFLRRRRRRSARSANYGVRRERKRPFLGFAKVVASVGQYAPVIGPVFGALQTVCEKIDEAHEVEDDIRMYVHSCEPLAALVKSMCDQQLDGPLHSLMQLLDERVCAALKQIQEVLSCSGPTRLLKLTKSRALMRDSKRDIDDAIRAVEVGLQTSNWTKLNSMADTLDRVEAGQKSVRRQLSNLKGMLRDILGKEGVRAEQQEQLGKAGITSVADLAAATDNELAEAGLSQAMTARVRRAARESMSPKFPRAGPLRLEIGQALFNKKYVVDRVLGRGSFGAVYLVTDKLADAERVVKVIECGEDEVVDVLREGRVLSKLAHNHIVRVLTLEREDMVSGVAVGLVMPYLQGQSLDAMQGNFDEGRVMRVAKHICSALVYLHGRSPVLLHRDIKPANIFYDAERDVFLLIDFGLIKETQSAVTSNRTVLAGTLVYMPPEVQGRDMVVPRCVHGFWVTLASDSSQRAL